MTFSSKKFKIKLKFKGKGTDNISMMRNFLNRMFGETEDTWVQAIMFVGGIVFFTAAMIFAMSPYVLVWV